MTLASRISSQSLLSQTSPPLLATASRTRTARESCAMLSKALRTSTLTNHSFTVYLCLCLCLSVSVSVRLPPSLSLSLSVYLCLCLCLYLSVCLSACRPACCLVCVSVCLSVCLSVCMCAHARACMHANMKPMPCMCMCMHAYKRIPKLASSEPRSKSGLKDMVLLKVAISSASDLVVGGQMPVIGSGSMPSPVICVKVTFSGGTNWFGMKPVAAKSSLLKPRSCQAVRAASLASLARTSSTQLSRAKLLSRVVYLQPAAVLQERADGQ